MYTSNRVWRGEADICMMHCWKILLSMTKFSTISLCLTKLYVTSSFAIASSSVKYSEIRENFSNSVGEEWVVVGEGEGGYYLWNPPPTPPNPACLGGGWGWSQDRFSYLACFSWSVPGVQRAGRAGLRYSFSLFSEI